MTDKFVTQSEFCYECTRGTANEAMEMEVLGNKLYIYYDITSTYVEMDDDAPTLEDGSRILSLYDIKHNIDAGKPILVNVEFDMGHCMVINGYSYNDVTNTGTVMYMDPYIGEYVSQSYEDFCYVKDVQTWYFALYQLNWEGSK